MPFYGPVHGESVLFLTKRRARSDPDAADDGQPPQLHRVAVAARSLARRGGRGARVRRSCRRRRAERLLVDGGRVVGVRTGDRGRGRAGRSSATSSRGRTSTARVTILAEGTQGHLTGAALDHFGLRSDNPQVWALGVKEVWKVAKPLARGRAHDGLAAARRPEVPRVRRLVRLSDGRRHGHDRHGRRARLPRRGVVGARPAAGAEDASARFGGSSKAASGCSGARRRFRRAASSRCRSGSTRRGCCCAATASGS